MTRRRPSGLLLLAALLFAGCESDEAKLQRLQTEASIARLSVLAIEQEIEEIQAELKRAGWNDSLLSRKSMLSDSLRKTRNNVLLAERALNRFLGR